MVIRETLSAILRAAAHKKLLQGWLFLPEGPLTVSSGAAFISDDAYNDEMELAVIAKENGFPIEGLETGGLEDVCQSALRLSSAPDDHLLLQAFLYYLKFDAFLPSINAGDPPSREEVLLSLDKTFYDSLGEERSDYQCRREGCTRGVVKLSAFCRMHHFENVRGRPCPFEQA